MVMRSPSLLVPVIFLLISHFPIFLGFVTIRSNIVNFRRNVASVRTMTNVQRLFQQPPTTPTPTTTTPAEALKKPPPPPMNPSPLETLKRIIYLSLLTVKITYMQLTLAVSNSLQNSKWLKSLSTVLRQRKNWIRLLVPSASFLLTRRYIAFSKSLTMEVSYAAFMKLLHTSPERIVALTVTPTAFLFRLDGTKTALTRAVSLDPVVLNKLLASGIDFAAPPTPANILGLLVTFGYMALLWTISSRMMRGPQDDGAGKRRDRGAAGGGAGDALNNLSFADVAGQERAKVEVMEVCDMLHDPSRYTRVGARLPAGVLLVGPPGTGKTLLARVAAAEAGVPFYACSASDFVEVYVGRGPARVRKLFKQAADNAPCIVFIDELDSVGRSRRLGSMNSEQENTLNQILTSMDGLDTSNNGVVVMGATNRFELLDPALLRAGRFDRIVQCPLPDREGRMAILSVHAKKFALASDVDLDRVARLTPGTCGADLSAICNEAAIRTVRRQGSTVSADDFDDALRSFFAGRGFPVAGMAEAAGLQMPSWLKGLVSQSSSSSLSGSGAGNNPAPVAGVPA